MPRSLVWFRRDLRVADQSALHHACQKSTEGVLGCYILTPDQWREHHDSPLKIDFWLRNLKLLSDELKLLNIPLLIVSASTYDDCPAAILKLAQQHECDTVFANYEYEVNERRRDVATQKLLSDRQIETQFFHDRVVVPPSDISTKDGRFYSVYTPYRRVWDTVVYEYLNIFDRPEPQKATGIAADSVPEQLAGFAPPVAALQAAWPAGEQAAVARLGEFASVVDAYGSGRDIPSVEGTSRLSAYLVAGVISPRQCVATILATHGQSLEKESGAGVWVSELTWRDFYTHVMCGFPRVSMDRPFKEKTEQLQWRTDALDFEAWKTGNTGYPIVDAGMRQLNQTGWMHNRLRMVTAMFLTKNLLIDWRWGERYFMQQLIDGDLAANNGGWQWSASTGTDAVPYFRIFNPFSQSKRFDPNGDFIKRYCPELQSVPATQLHDVSKFAKAVAGLDYPDYCVDYKVGRERALDAFKSLS